MAIVESLGCVGLARDRWLPVRVAEVQSSYSAGVVPEVVLQKIWLQQDFAETKSRSVQNG